MAVNDYPTTAVTRTLIFNGTLSFLGESAISGDEEDSHKGRTLRNAWPVTLKTCLEGHSWNFLIRREKLALLADEPVFGWDYAYALPADFHRLVSVHNSAESDDNFFRDYEIEDGKLLSNYSEMWLRYVKNGEFYGAWSGLFQSYVECELAVRVCRLLVDSRAKLDEVTALRDDYFSKAKNHDAQLKPFREYTAGRLVRSRRNLFGRERKW